MTKKFFIIVIMLVFVLFMASCLNAGGKKNETVKEDSAVSSQTSATIAEGNEEESVQTTETAVYDEAENLDIKETNPEEGEYFVYAILKSIDIQNNTIIVEQLINEPNEKEIQPEVALGQDCQIIKIVLEQATEKETLTEIRLNDIGINSEIGIIFKSDNTARAIIFQEMK